MPKLASGKDAGEAALRLVRAAYDGDEMAWRLAVAKETFPVPVAFACIPVLAHLAADLLGIIEHYASFTPDEILGGMERLVGNCQRP